MTNKYTPNDFKFERPSNARLAQFIHLRDIAAPEERQLVTVTAMDKIYSETCLFLHWSNMSRLTATADELTQAQLIITAAKAEDLSV